MDAVWVTHVPDDVVVARLVERNGLAPDAARARLGAQMPRSARLARAGVAVDTSGPKEATREALRGHWEALVARLRAEDAAAAAASGAEGASGTA
jgi:dephospho-CoA kinase